MNAVDYFYLCGNCGGVAVADDFELFQRDHETGNWRPHRHGEMDPMVKCPLCDWEHVDDDSSPGLWDGTRLEIQRQRRDLLRDPIWAEAWSA